MTNKPPVIFLMGPTASGKTELAMALREHLPVELVSVDSTLVYRGMDIGTAKPSPEELARAPHRLIDIRDPAEPYSAADFRADAEREVADIVAQGRIPLLVGGTMLYFKTLLEGLAEMPPAVPAVRQDIEQEAAQHGWPHIHAQLAAVDPESAARIHPNHSQRLSRALEVYRASGRTMTEMRRAQHERSGPAFGERYRICQMALTPGSRNLLHERIAKRFHQMVERGLVAEVEALHERRDLHSGLPAIRAVGYRQVWDYLEGQAGRGARISREQMIERGIIATRQLAKRQLTWLKGWPELKWLLTRTEPGNSRSFEEILQDSLNFIGPRAI